VRVWRSVLGQRIGGNGAIVSMMLESCLEEGNQSVAIGRKGCAMAYP
jgi:3-deoxy-D-arabino-heptulosonate 7-phosphate (DAHP) synthase